MNGVFQKGSEWRKWDLHVHSPLSILNNQYPKLNNGKPDWEPYLEKLESQDVAVIGITDYFTIEGYKVVKKFKEEGRLKNIYTVLPNIEFRLKNIITARNGAEKRLNLHVIFSDEVSIIDIEEHFLHDLHFIYEGDPENRDERKKLKLSNLELLGSNLKEQHASFSASGVSDLEIGATQAVVDHEEISIKLSDDSRFRGKYIIILTESDWDQISWEGQAHHLRKTLLQKSGMVFTSNPSTRQWCLGKGSYTEGQIKYIEEFKTLKPCIHGSDAHTIGDIYRPCARRGDSSHNCEEDPSGCDLRYCWIKADPTFEGLRQLLYEPEDRVAIQQYNPQPVISNFTITGFRIDGTTVNEELSISDANLKINTALVAVVGGRGAGKTALVDMIANCYMDRTDMEDNNSFVKRIDEHNPNLRTTLLLIDGSEFTKNLGDKTIYEDGQIMYIAQGELERYIGEQSDIQHRIRELIFESPQIKNTVLSFEFDEAILRTEDLEINQADTNKIIEDLEAKTDADISQAIEHEKTRIESDIKDIEKRIHDIGSIQSESDRGAAEGIQDKLGKLKEKQSDLTALKEALENALEFIVEHLGEFNEIIEATNKLIKKLEMGESYPRLSYSSEEKLEEMLESVRSQRKGVVADIESLQKELEERKREIKEYAKLLERRRELQSSLESVHEKEKQLRDNLKRLEEAEKERLKITKELLASIIAQKGQYENIIRVFCDRKAEVLSEIDFIAEIRFDERAFLNKAEGILDKRKISDIEQAFYGIIRLAYAFTEDGESRIDELVDEIGKCSKEHKTKVKGMPVTVGDFYSTLYCNYMKVVPVVKYKKTYLEKLSLGQKATVLLKIYLAHGDKPIIIDSHDDHLDNEFIMEELVRSIRQAKSYRQIVLVSNNGNVVINSDAEQVIIANRDGGEISYIAGSIENPTIRERALGVLEGGHDAFKRRQQKYRLGL